MTELERFYQHTRPEGDCLVWTSTYRLAGGYGQYRRQMAHRVAWTFANGQIPEGLLVCHRCDNPPCVRVEHLELGTHADNMADRNSRGRQAKGARHGKTRLTENDVLAIRAMREGGTAVSHIAEAFGISRASVSDITSRRRWSWL